MKRIENHIVKTMGCEKAWGGKEQHLFSIPYGWSLGFTGGVVGEQAGEVR